MRGRTARQAVGWKGYRERGSGTAEVGLTITVVLQRGVIRGWLLGAEGRQGKGLYSATWKRQVVGEWDEIDGNFNAGGWVITRRRDFPV